MSHWVPSPSSSGAEGGHEGFWPSRLARTAILGLRASQDHRVKWLCPGAGVSLTAPSHPAPQEPVLRLVIPMDPGHGSWWRGPPEELAEGLVIGQRMVVGLREQVLHIVQAPLGHELPRGLGLLGTPRPEVGSEQGPSNPYPNP